MEALINWFGMLPPGIIMIIGGLLLPLVGRKAAGVTLALASTSLLLFALVYFNGGYETPSTFTLMGMELNPVRVDSLSMPFTIVFHIAAIISCIYSLHVDDVKQHLAGITYAGSAIAAACAGDLVTLFVCWELTAVTSVFLIWARGTNESYRAGIRYLIIGVGSGVLLLTGTIIHFVETGSLIYESFLVDHRPTTAGWFVLGSLAIKAAFPLLHNWLQDSYPKATATGTVFLSAFTTKLAIYALIRGFAGFESLIAVGCVMTLFPIVFAVIENDLRKVLAYSLNNQLGFMVVGIGIGSELAINGTVAHAFCHIIYKSLLFMSMGAVLHRVGTCKATELGGLYKSMPWTTGFCIIGAGSISGFPLLSGFVSKSMIITAAAEHHDLLAWLVLLIASAGVMEHSGIKIPFFAFFSHDAGHRVEEAPGNMLVAMAIASAFCIGLGIAYPLLYALLPYTADYHPFTAAHVINQLQLLMFAALAFLVLIKLGLYPAEKRAENLDTDVVYRRWLPKMIGGGSSVVSAVDTSVREDGVSVVTEFLSAIKDAFGPNGTWGRTWSSSTMTFWAVLLLAVCLLLYYSP